MWGIEGFIVIEGYRKGYLVKIRDYFIGNIYWEGDSTKVLF
jgi:hypothetical protein